MTATDLLKHIGRKFIDNVTQWGAKAPEECVGVLTKKELETNTMSRHQGAYCTPWAKTTGREIQISNFPKVQALAGHLSAQPIKHPPRVFNLGQLEMTSRIGPCLKPRPFAQWFRVCLVLTQIVLWVRPFLPRYVLVWCMSIWPSLHQCSVYPFGRYVPSFYIFYLVESNLVRCQD